MKALTLRQPWAWAVLHAGKDIENRVWSRDFRGPLAIHAGKKFERDAELPHEVTYEERDIVRGAIIGIVDVVDIVERHQSRWYSEGNFAWVLRNPRPLVKPISCKGGLGLWNVPDDVVRKITRQIGTLEEPTAKVVQNVRVLSEGEKLVIRKRIQSGRATNEEIAAEFGCAKSQVVAIKAVMNRR